MNVNRKLLLSSATVPALLTAMTVMACSGDHTASATELEGRLQSGAGAPRAAERELAPRGEAYVPVAPPARDDNYRTADYVPPRARQDQVTYQAPSSRWDPAYVEGAPSQDDSSSSAYDDQNVATEVSLRDGDWRSDIARSEPTYRTLTVETGTPIAIEMRDVISTRSSRPGESFSARLAGDLLADDGRVAIQDGAAVTGRVVEVRKSQRIGGRAGLTVSFDSIELPDGTSAPLQASWEKVGESQTKKDAATIGGATIGGAILGRILDKDNGDVIGGVVGAAAGTAVARQKVGQPIVLDSGAILHLHLRAPIEVRVHN